MRLWIARCGWTSHHSRWPRKCSLGPCTDGALFLSAEHHYDVASCVLTIDCQGHARIAVPKDNTNFQDVSKEDPAVALWCYTESGTLELPDGR